MEPVRLVRHSKRYIHRFLDIALRRCARQCLHFLCVVSTAAETPYNRPPGTCNVIADFNLPNVGYLADEPLIFAHLCSCIKAQLLSLQCNLNQACTGMYELDLLGV